MTFIFDNRPSSSDRDAKAVFDAFKKESVKPHCTGCAFLSSFDILPLQAADMIAWELYQHANDILMKGLLVPPQRQQFKRLSSSMTLHAQIATRSNIPEIVAFWQKQNPNDLKRMADHFVSFDPENSDYSYLSGAQSS